MDTDALRDLPSVDKLASRLEGGAASARLRVRAARETLDGARARLLSGGHVSEDELVREAESLCGRLEHPTARPVINMSGVILHTGLGRARLSEATSKAVQSASNVHTMLELDWETGARGDRLEGVRTQLQELTGAEDALVVNNCAAAVLLALTAHCAGRDVLLSRGQMVEIGGSFRMPDIVRQPGCRLVEVGCTNKTRLSDYSEAWTGETAAVLRCHPSNFRIVGFTEEPSARELADLAHERGSLLIDDVGHGCLVDTTTFGLPKERTLKEAVCDGADLVLASGDKLLGGPQAGIVLGRKDAVRTMARHPLARALRVDKLVLAALSQTLAAYQDGVETDLPTWRSAGKALDQVKEDAVALSQAYAGSSVVEPGETEMGGGSMPGRGIPTWRVGLEAGSADGLLAELRQGLPSVIGRIERGLVWLDPRTAESDEVKNVCTILRGLTS